ncbi:MAG TPA: helix-turn-helix domain-containing protein [Gemmatimonadaceae bacterium]|nr:helix-turn-helix domain-containing protein [Gemmatimonadaceae bacterium]
MALHNEFLVIGDRPSDSPFVERIWRSHSERAGTMMSVASCHCEMVVTRHEGNITLTLRGPETRPTTVDCPAGAEWVGIRFSLGSFMPHYPAGRLMNRNDVNLHATTRRSFWLQGSVLEYPDFENAESLVRRLVKLGLLVRDPAVAAALRGEAQALSRRSSQRHFLRATGMTHTSFRKIERARYAARLLRQGISIADTVHETGYYDQAHLTRSLRNLIGVTPASIGRQESQLSFLYKTEATP